MRRRWRRTSAARGTPSSTAFTFDTGKDLIKPESEPALAEIGKLLTQDRALKLYVVGHTDNVGGFDSNIDLSEPTGQCRRRPPSGALRRRVHATAIGGRRFRCAGGVQRQRRRAGEEPPGRARQTVELDCRNQVLAMIAAMVFAHVWGLLQLVALGSFARTVRLLTVLMAMVAGLFACAALAVVLEIGGDRCAAGLTGMPLSELVLTASFTIDPFVEELAKVLPLALLLSVRVIRRQWSVTDCVLVGAALGAGFGLAEELYRFGAAPANADWSAGGWVVRTGWATVVTVPGLWTTLTSWLPRGAAPESLFSLVSDTLRHVNLHLVWSAVGGFGLGLIRLHRGSRPAVRAGIICLLYVSLDHALINWALNASPSGFAASLSRTLQGVTWFLPVAALAAAWWFDRQREASETPPDVTLAAEKTTSPSILGTWRTALDCLPWSALSVDALVRIRRAHARARAEGVAAPDPLHARIVDLRDRIDRAVGRPIPLASSVAWTRAVALAALQTPSVIARLLLMTPSLLWFVIGGLPATGWLQGVLVSRPAWAVTRLLSAVALVWTAWNVIAGLRVWRRVARSPVADVPAIFALRLLAGAGAVALGGYVFSLSIRGGSPDTYMIDQAHIIDALKDLTSWLGDLLTLSGPFLSSAGGIPPTLRTPYAPPGAPNPRPFNPEIPVVEPGPPNPGGGFQSPVPPGPEHPARALERRRQKQRLCQRQRLSQKQCPCRKQCPCQKQCRSVPRPRFHGSPPLQQRRRSCSIRHRRSATKKNAECSRSRESRTNPPLDSRYSPRRLRHHPARLANPSYGDGLFIPMVKSRCGSRSDLWTRVSPGCLVTTPPSARSRDGRCLPAAGSCSRRWCRSSPHSERGGHVDGRAPQGIPRASWRDPGRGGQANRRSISGPRTRWYAAGGQ